MRRLLLVLFVGFLTASTAGAVDLVVPERCSSDESTSAPADGSCPSTCVRCHCARAFEIVFYPAVAHIARTTPEWFALASLMPLSVPRDILHVPRPTFG